VAAAGITGLAGTKSVAVQGGVLSFPVNVTNTLGSFAGSFDVSQFAVQQGQVVALGTLVGQV